MFFPEKMKKITALIDRESQPRVSKKLLQLGVMQFVSINEFTGVHPLHKETDKETLADLKNRIESFLSQGETNYLDTVDLSTDALVSFSVDGYTDYLNNLAGTLMSVKEKQRDIQQKILQLEELERHLARYPEALSDIPEGSGAFIQVSYGYIKKSLLDSFQKALTPYTHIMLPGAEEETNIFIVLITLTRDSKELNTLLQRFQWTDATLLPEEAGDRTSIDKNILSQKNEYAQKQSEYAAQVQGIIDEKSTELCDMWQKVRLAELDTTMREWFGSTTTAVLFSGWIPARDAQKVEEAIRNVTDDTVYIEWSEAYEKMDAPVQLKNPRFLRPFQKLVENYSIPRYGTIDPTPLTAITFLIMFGLMFGDIGQGLVLFLAGLLGSLKWNYTEKWGNLSRLIIWCGLSSTLFGLLFGSCFGYGWFPPLWFDYHAAVVGHSDATGLVNNIYDILGLTLIFGVVIIGLSILLNWINCISLRRWRALLLDKKGVLGGWIYAGGVYTGWYYIQSNFSFFPPMQELLFLIIVPTAFLPVYPLLEGYFHGAYKTNMVKEVGNHLIEGIVEIIETYSGYLSNTLSFMRVAGLGIAHVSLMSAFFEIAAMTQNQIFSISIIVVGNILVIVLEGLSAGIQSLRLNYYEFFSRYFVGEGKKYTPVQLNR